MIDKPIFFSVCRYIPDILRGESINVGIVVHVPEDKWAKFYATKNISRIRSFDDEVETNVLRAILNSLSYQFDTDRTPDLAGINDKKFLEKELVYYINQIQFSEIRVLNSNEHNLTKDIDDLIDMYLYYDKKSSDRIDSNRVRSLASKIVSQSYLKNYIDRNPEVKNRLNQCPFDFSINISGETSLFKALSFDYKRHNTFYNEVKSLMFDLNYFKKEKQFKNIKVIINNTEVKEEHERLAYNLISEVADVYTLEQFDKYIHTEEQKNERQLSFFSHNKEGN